jgi:hypothetical protein
LLSKKNLSLISFLILILSLLSCSDSPSDVGADLLKIDMINVLKLDSNLDSIPQQSSSLKKIIPLGNSPRLLLGKYQDYTAYTLISFTFTLPDSIKRAIQNDSLEVLDAKGELNVDYQFGAISVPFDFSIYEIQSFWNSVNFSVDSFTALSYSNLDLSSNKVDRDSIFYFNISPNIVKNWLKSEVDTSVKNRGVLLSPTPNTGKIIGFVAFNPDLSNDTKVNVIVRKPGAYVDTLLAYVLSDVSVVIGNNQIEPNYITIQSSLAYQGKLSFDLSSLKKGSVVNYAQLSLTIDTLKSKFGNKYFDELRAYIITSSDSLSIIESSFYPLRRIGDKYVGDISGIVRYWTSNNPNYGILLKAGSEIVGIEKFMIKGSSYPIYSDRPKLEIIYTMRN